MAHFRNRNKANHRILCVGGKFEDAGLTLIEVMVALVIVSIGLLGIAALQATAIGGNRAARMQTEATALAARTLEQLRLLPFDHPDLSAGTAPRRLASTGTGVYALQWTVIDDQPVADAKTVQVQVNWPGAHSGRAVRLRTIVANRTR